MSSFSQSQANSSLTFDGNILADKTSDQLAALKALLTELKHLSDDVDKSSLDDVSKKLVSSKILRSRDSGIQAYGACCLNEILKIHAPDAPYSAKVLNEIFNLFIKLFRHLSNQNHPYFQQVHLLIENMVQIHVIALACDLPNAESLITNIFNMFYRMANESLVPGMDILMTSVLSQIIEYYSQPLPHGVVTLILSNFLNYPKASKDSKNASLPLIVPVGYVMSKTLCADNVDVLVKYTNQYFSDILNPGNDDDDDDDGDNNDIEDDYDEDDDDENDPIMTKERGDIYSKTVTLLVEIWKAVPELLAFVIGQLQQDLLIDNLKLRLLATDSIGKMIRYTTVRGDFVRDYSPAYHAWLGRVKDVSPRVRVRWTEAAGDILEHRGHVAKDLVQSFVNRLDDTDESVRARAVDIAGDLSNSTVVNKIAPYYRDTNVLGPLAGRLRDKKPQVRVKGFAAVGKLYNKSYGLDGFAGEVFDWIPSKVLEQVYLNDKAVNELIDETEFEYLFPKQLDDNKRTQRVLKTLKNLTPQASKAFNAFAQRQVETARYVNMLLVSLKKKQDEGPSDQLKQRINSMKYFFGAMFGNADKVAEAIDYLVQSNDKNLCKFIANCVNPASDYKTVVQSINEAMRRSPPKHANAFKLLLYRASYWIYNKSILTPVVEISRATSADELGAVAHSFLKEIATHCPVLLTAQASKLTEIIQSTEPGKSGNVDTLKAANLLFNRTTDNFPDNDAFMKSVYKLCTVGTPAESKQAVKLISHSKKKEMYQNRLVTEIIARFNQCETREERDEALITTKLAALAQLSLNAPDLVDSYQEVITPYLIKNFILTNEKSADQHENDDGSSDGEKIKDASLPEDEDLDDYCMRKILALRYFVNQLRSHDGYENSQEIAAPLFKMLLSLVGNGGEISKKSDTPAVYRTRLRLEAGLKLLKLAKYPTYEKMIRAQDLNKIGMLLQEEDLQVRSRLVRTLTRYLSSPVDPIPDRYLALVFLMAYEVDDGLYNHVTTWIRAKFAHQQEKSDLKQKGASQTQKTSFELCFARLLSLLAHHQEYLNDPEEKLDDLKKLMHYLLYYLTLVANSRNISFIFFISQRVKQYRDYDENEQDVYSERLWTMSDFAQFLIIQYRKLKNWNLETWPNKLALPSDAFRPMPDSNTSKKVAVTSYIDIDTMKDKLEAEMKKALHHKSGHDSKKNSEKLASKDDDDSESENEAEVEMDEAGEELPVKQEKPSRRSLSAGDKNHGSRKVAQREAQAEDRSREETESKPKRSNSRRKAATSKKRAEAESEEALDASNGNDGDDETHKSSKPKSKRSSSKTDIPVENESDQKRRRSGRQRKSVNYEM